MDSADSGFIPGIHKVSQAAPEIIHEYREPEVTPGWQGEGRTLKPKPKIKNVDL